MTSRFGIFMILPLGVVLGTTPLAAQATRIELKPATESPKRSHRPAPERHNPVRVRASQVLGLDQPGSPRVRFEWPAVEGAHVYLLLGAITDARTWRVTNTEHRVSAANAAEWSPGRVVFETPLNPGIYSWKLVALFEPNDVGDFAAPTVVTFEVR